MKLKSHWYLVLVLAMAAVPTLAQFEISPDQYPESQSSSRNPGNSIPAADLKQQIAEQNSLLASYRRQIKVQAALVEQARQVLISPEGSADEAGESIALSALQSRLEALQRLLEDPIRVAEANLASLESRHAALMAAGKERSSAVRRANGQESVMTASSQPGSLDPVIHGVPSRTSETKPRETPSR